MVDGSSRAAIECALVSIIAPGDKVLVCSAGRFGSLLAEIATRVGGDVTVITKEWGHVFELAEIKAAIDEVQPKLVCTVAGDTSTTMLQPLEGLGDICHAAGAFLMTDATASFAGNDLRCAEWGIDIATAGMQKCMGGPAGISPIVVSPEAFKAMVARKSIEEGIADSPRTSCPSRSAFAPTTSTSRSSSITGARAASTTTPRPRTCSTPRTRPCASSARRASTRTLSATV